MNFYDVIYNNFSPSVLKLLPKFCVMARPSLTFLYFFLSSRGTSRRIDIFKKLGGLCFTSTKFGSNFPHGNQSFFSVTSIRAPRFKVVVWPMTLHFYSS